LIGIVIGIIINPLLRIFIQSGYTQDSSYYGVNINSFDNYKLFVDIVKNNMISNCILISGFLSFGAQTFINLILNGILFGFYIYFATTYGDVWELFILVMPHSIFEIPAIIIAGAAGFKIPYEIIRYLMGKKEQVLTKKT